MLFEINGLPYLILFICISLFAFVELFNINKIIKYYLFLTSSLLIITLVSIRWEIGTDWDNYLTFFISRVNGSGSSFEYYFDTGYVLLNDVIAFLSSKYTIFLIISTILSSGLIFILLGKYTANPNIGLLIFYGSYLPIHFVGSVRRSIALSFVILFLITFTVYKEKIKSSLFFIVAFLFHKTSIVTFPLFFIKSKPYKLKSISLVFLVTLTLGVLNISELLMTRIKDFLPNETSIGVFVTLGNYAGDIYKEHTPESIDPIKQSMLSLIKKYIMFIFFYLAIRRGYFKSALEGKLYNLYALGVGVYSLFIGAPILQTLAIYYLIFEIFLASILIDKLKKYEKIIFFIFLFLSSFLSYQSGLSVYPELFFPYKTIFY